MINQNSFNDACNHVSFSKIENHIEKNQNNSTSTKGGRIVKRYHPEEYLVVEFTPTLLYRKLLSFQTIQTFYTIFALVCATRGKPNKNQQRYTHCAKCNTVYNMYNIIKKVSCYLQ